MPRTQSALLEQWNIIADSAENLFLEHSKKKKKERNVLAMAALSLRNALSGWKQDKPGEGTLAAFFVTHRGERVIPDELVAPSDRQRAEASGYKIVPFDSIWQISCPNCGTRTPVIEDVLRAHRFFAAPCLFCFHVQSIDPPKE